MKYLLIIYLILLIPIVQAEEDLDLLSSITIESNLDTKIAASGSNSLSSLNAHVFLYPQSDSLQEVLNLNTYSNPQATEKINDKISFEWNSYNPKYNLGYTSRIKTTHKIHEIPQINYPYTNLGSEFDEYLKPEELIDITPEIRKKTSEIISGETNAYLTVHKIADWTKDNIQYNLTTLTAKQSLKSSWVLENRRGVCDELTSLFISMLRSAGIPARFISGMAYTNVIDDFGNHGWAEVYFPEYGWVPYDVTYGQFGYIDATHVTLSRTLDSGEASIKYTWKSKGTNIEPLGIDTEAKIISKGNKINPIFDLRITPLVEKVGPNSFFPIRVDIKNPKDAYLTTQTVIKKAPGIHNDNSEMVALRPLENKEVYYIGKVTDQLDSGYTYTSILEVEDSLGSSAQSSIELAKNYDIITLKEAQDMIDDLISKEEGKSSSKVILNCNPKKEYFYTFEEIKIICSVRNLEENLNDLELCLNNKNCKQFSLKNQETREIEFIPEKEDRVHTAILTFDNSKITRNVLLSIYDKPDLQITNINYPLNVNYDEQMQIEMELATPTLVKNIQLKVNGLSTIEIPEIAGSKEFTLNINSKAVSSGRIKFTINYFDEYGNPYSSNKEFDINVHGAPFWERVINFIQSLFS